MAFVTGCRMPLAPARRRLYDRLNKTYRLDSMSRRRGKTQEEFGSDMTRAVQCT